MGGDTSQYYPDLVYDNHQVAPPTTPEEGYHLTEDLVDRAIEFIADAKQVAPDKPFFMYFCTGRDARAASGAARVDRQVQGQFDDGWDAYREKVFEQPARARPPAAGHQALRARSRRAGLEEPRRRREAALRAHDGGVRRLPRAHRPPDRPAARRSSRSSGSSTTRIVMVVSDNGASAEGGPHGSVNENLFFNNVPETLEDNLKAIDELGGPEVLQPLPVGLGLGGQHAVPSLEARDLPRRRQRSVHRPLAEGHQGARARSARSTRTSSTWCRRCSRRSASKPPAQIRGVTQSPIQGVSFAAHVRRRQGARPGTTRSTSR